MKRIDVPTFKAQAKTLAGHVLETHSQHKKFTISVHRDNLIVTPLSTGKPRPIATDQIEQFLELFAANGSFHPKIISLRRATPDISWCCSEPFGIHKI